MALIAKDIDIVERLELDLLDKARAGYDKYPEVNIKLYGMFSLDHLEQMRESDFDQGLAVGVGYVGTEPANDNTGLNVDRGRAVKMIVMSFIVVLAVPAVDGNATRHNATKLLTILRREILGKAVAGDNTSRTWNLAREKPEISESSRDMLYYSQLWQVAMPILGN